MAPVAFWVVTLFLMGITVGSFLTAVIYRLGHNASQAGKRLSLLEPQRSMCPNCKHSLGAIDLVPLFSFLGFGRKCHYCKTPISWRYFVVELLTGLSFVAVYFKFPHLPQDAPTLVAMLAFVAVLIPIFFIDLETYTIPISLTLLTTVIPLARDGWGIAHHEAGFDLLWGWMPRSLMGAIIGALIFGLVRVAGWLYKGVEAMGIGDVFLARGMGAMFLVVMPADVGYWPFPLWVILACVAGILVYPIDKAIRRQNSAKNPQKILDRYGNSPASVEIGRDVPEELSEQPNSLLKQLQDVGMVLVGYDAYEWAMYTFSRNYRESIDAEIAKYHMEEEAWTPAATAIPFGPSLVVGFLLTIFFGHGLILAYLAYSHLLPEQNPPNI